MFPGRSPYWQAIKALAVAGGLLLAIGTAAEAQTAADTSIQRMPSAPRLRVLNPGPDAPDVPQAATVDADAPTGGGLAGGLPPERDPTDVDDDSDQPRADGAGRPVVRDGDLNWPPGPQQPIDGVVQTGEPVGPKDGGDPTTVDQRAPDSIAAFENPPAGYDPRLFEIELSPLADRRIERLFRFEPFEPIGVRVGSFVVFPELETGIAGFSNVQRSSVNGRRDTAIETRASVRAVSDWNVHALEMRAAGTGSWHRELPSENDRGYELELRGRLDITRRTNIEGLVSQSVAQEIRGSIDTATTANDRADVTTRRAATTFNHRFNRLSIQLRGGVSDTEYGSLAAPGGGIQANDERNFVQRNGAVRVAWAFKPTLSVFGETEVNRRDYEAVSLSDGLRRDSEGDRWRGGVSFGNQGSRLRGEFSAGFGRQRPEESRLPEVNGILLDANLSLRLSALTALRFTANTELEGSTIAGSSGAVSRSLGLQARHEFGRRLIGTAGVRTTRLDYAGISLAERETVADIGAEYFFNRDVSVFGRYAHTWFTNNAPGGDYEADEVRIGVRLRR